MNAGWTPSPAAISYVHGQPPALGGHHSADAEAKSTASSVKEWNSGIGPSEIGIADR